VQEESLDKQKSSEDACGGISLTAPNGFIESWLILRPSISYLPVTVAEPSKACTVFVRSEAGIVGLKPTQGMDVRCVCAFFCVCVVLCLGIEALRRADHPSKESYRLWIINKLRYQRYAPKWEQDEEKKIAT
jgi:hypothetical protein